MAASTRLPILVVNPNTTEAMTASVETMLSPLLTDTSFPKPTYFTCPSPGVASINSSHDCHQSAMIILPHLIPLLSSHSAVLIACYSHHPLVQQLLPYTNGEKPVLGIFEASVLSSMANLASTLQLKGHHEGSASSEQDEQAAVKSARARFGIVSTGKVWESLLTQAVDTFLGTSENSALFAGVETTGLTAVEVHDSSPELVKKRTKDAVTRLLRKGDVGAICLGCAGFAGMDHTVREAAVEELGAAEGERVKIIDGVKVGYFMLEGMVKTGL
ncbi:BQ2448_6490 [Microbotryum intermedium]|uniref:BQ2448_6490 protein n=1 Tax=Microbotryum intermedium TaxID=269621 RepID=A0A238FS52_9BASI|nr:BQ2448_6490 [Microbotryum intermedium]